MSLRDAIEGIKDEAEADAKLFAQEILVALLSGDDMDAIEQSGREWVDEMKVKYRARIVAALLAELF